MLLLSLHSAAKPPLKQDCVLFSQPQSTLGKDRVTALTLAASNFNNFIKRDRLEKTGTNSLRPTKLIIHFIDYFS